MLWWGRKRAIAGAKEYDYVPRDYEDLYLYYIVGDGYGNSLAHRLVRSFMTFETPEEREDLVNDIFLRALEKDILKVYDPEKANFGGVIFFLTRTVCVNFLARKGRNPSTGLLAGYLVEEGDLEEGRPKPGEYNIDRLSQDNVPRYEEQEIARRVINELEVWANDLRQKNRHIRDRSIWSVLEYLVAGEEPKDMAKKLGVSVSTTHNWIDMVREKTWEIQKRYD